MKRIVEYIYESTNCNLINLAQFKRNIDEKSTLENLTLERVRETCEKKKKKKNTVIDGESKLSSLRDMLVWFIFVSVSKRNEKKKNNKRGKRKNMNMKEEECSNRIEAWNFFSCKLNARFDYYTVVASRG